MQELTVHSCTQNRYCKEALRKLKNMILLFDQGTSYGLKFRGVILHYTPLAVLKVKDSGTAPGHWFFPEAREFSRSISAKSVFRQPGFPWNYLIGSHYHMTLFVGVAVAEPVPAIMPRFLISAPLNLL